MFPNTPKQTLFAHEIASLALWLSTSKRARPICRARRGRARGARAAAEPEGDVVGCFIEGVEGGDVRCEVVKKIFCSAISLAFDPPGLMNDLLEIGGDKFHTEDRKIEQA